MLYIVIVITTGPTSDVRGKERGTKMLFDWQQHENHTIGFPTGLKKKNDAASLNPTMFTTEHTF